MDNRDQASGRDLGNTPEALVNQTKQIHKNQKIATIVLAIFSILVIVMMITQFRYNIRAPFQAPSDNIAIASGASVTDNIMTLKNKDTDGDGLSDYDETYVYQTSPYLEDTDSDGFKDYEEVKNGTNPNCPAGQNCNNLLISTSTVLTPDLISDIATSGDLSIKATSTNDSALNNMLSGASDAASLRQMLIQGGADKNALDKISDADLIASYQEVLLEQAQGNTTVQ